MDAPSLVEQLGSLPRLFELVQVLASNGFAHLVRASGMLDLLPSPLLAKLEVLESSRAQPETVGIRLRRVLSQLGPTFVKLGQVLATRADLLDEDICEELGKLQDQAQVTPFEKIRPVLVATLGAPPEELFEDFDETPIAAASISQVYKARLPGGEAVAVKVQRPGTAEAIESDLRMLRAVASWVGSRGEGVDWADPRGVVEEFARSVRRELDFSQERRVLERFQANFADDERVKIPRVYPERSGTRVLTLEWIDGRRVDDLSAYADRRSDPKAVARLGCEVVCRQVFEHRFFHADPHPGNVVLTHDDTVAFLDYGMVGHLAAKDVESLADLLRAVMEQDAEACVRIMLVFTTAGYIEDPRALQHELADYLAFEAHAIIDEGRVGAALEALTGILRRHHLELAPRFTLLLKALATIESTAHRLDPELQIVPVLRPFVEELVLQRFSPSRLAARAEQELSRGLRILHGLPADIQAIAGQVRRGRLHVGLEHERLDELTDTIDRASGRLSFAIVMASLVMGSSWLLSTDVVAHKAGVGGLVVALILGVLLAISVIRGRAGA